MALTPQQIFDKYNVLFADNNTGEISELDLRNFVKDLTDAMGAAEVSSIIPTWAAGLTFQTDGTGDGEFCRHADSSGNIRLFQTKTDNNTGNEPPTDPNTTENTHWIEISASSSSAFVEWSAGIYGAGLVIVYYNANFYILTQGVRPFNSTTPPDVDTGNWQQITNVSGGSGGSGTEIGLGERTIDTTLTSPAGQNEIRFDNLTTVTEVYLHEDDENGTDRSASINEITATSQLKVRLVSDPENFFKILKVVSQTDNTGSHTVGVTQLESKGDWSGLNGQAVSVNVDLKEDISGKADKTELNVTDESFSLTTNFDSWRASTGANKGSQSGAITFIIDKTGAKSGRYNVRHFISDGSNVSISNLSDGDVSTIPTGLVKTNNTISGFQNGELYSFTFWYFSTSVWVIISNPEVHTNVTTLNAVTLNSVSQDSGTQLTANWTDTNSSPNEESFEIQYDTVNTFDSGNEATLTAAQDAVSKQITLLNPSTTYYVRVRPIGDGVTTATGPWSNVVSQSTVNFEAEATAFIARLQTAGATVSDNWKSAINSLFVNLKNGSINFVSVLNTLQIYDSLAEQGAMFNWITDARNGSYVGTPAFTAKSGIQTNGTDNAINTGVNPSSSLSLNDCNVGFRISNFTLIAAGQSFMGAQENVTVPNSALQLSHTSGGLLFIRVNDFTSNLYDIDPSGEITMSANRPDSTLAGYRENGAVIQQNMESSVRLPNMNIYLGGSNAESSGGLSAPISANYKYFYAGPAMTTTAEVELQGILDDYLTEISTL